MHIQFEKYNDILDDTTGFGHNIINDIVRNIMSNAMAYCKQQKRYYKDKYDLDIKTDIDIFRVIQTIIDTFEDLKRLKEFHPIQYPNRLKCASYLAYWWKQREPITFSICSDQMDVFLKKVKQKDIARFINCNELWLVAFVLGEIFTTDEKLCIKNDDEASQNWKTELDYIFYYFCYRLNSPKDIEAFLSTSILHPMWKVKDGVYFDDKHL